MQSGEDMSMIVRLIESIVTPTNAALSKYSEALATVAGLIQRLAESSAAEPTHRTIIAELRQELMQLSAAFAVEIQKHESGCQRRASESERDGSRYADDSTRKVIDELRAIISEHNTQVEDFLRPVKKMKQSYDRAVWVIVTVASLALPTMGYIAWALSHLPTIPGVK